MAATRQFRGESTHKVDAKGRVSIPASFRRVIELGDPDWEEGKPASFVIVYGDARRKFLEGFTMTAMAEVDAQIAALPRGSRERRILERLFSGQALQASVDETGRIVLPQKLRDKLGIRDEAFFIASGDTFQIWEPSTYEATEAQIDAWYDELEEEYGADFDPLILLEAKRRHDGERRE